MFNVKSHVRNIGLRVKKTQQFSLPLYYPRRYRPGITNQNHRARNQEPHTLDHSRSSNPFIACVHGFGDGLTAIHVVGVLLDRGNFMGCALPVSIVGRYIGSA